jgi:hypothetical protein
VKIGCDEHRREDAAGLELHACSCGGSDPYRCTGSEDYVLPDEPTARGEVTS